MVRCGCSSDRCSCKIVAGDGVTISGIGSDSNPYVVEAVAPESGGSISGRFVGEIIATAGSIAPPGCLPCDGSAVSRTVYSALFANIGVAYGAGDGSTTFNVPNSTDRVPLGASPTHPRGSSSGSTTRTITTANLPSHTHGINHDHTTFTTPSGGPHRHDLKFSANLGGSGTTIPLGTVSLDRISPSAVESSGEHTHTVDVPPYTGSSAATGSGTPLDITPPNFAVNYYIKY